MGKNRTATGYALALVAATLFGPSALALINPNFTPVHLADQSDLILELQVGAAKDGKVTAQIKRVLKGKTDGKTLELTLSASTAAEHVKALTTVLDRKDGQLAVFFVGGFNEAGGGPAAGQKAFLHVGGTWVAFSRGKNQDWEMTQLAESMNTTWNGGTDMLIRATEYILANPGEAEVPVTEGVRWSSVKDFGKIAGAVRAAMPVDLAGDGKLTLYVACEGGDRLYKYDAKADTMADITATAKLTAKSKLAAWGDFNADGRMDLLSFDGEAMTIHTQTADPGAPGFKAGDKLLKGALSDGCLGLTIVDSGKPGKPAVVIATKTAPMLWLPTETAAKPIGGEFAGAALGAAGSCLVADFDADGIPDILQLFEKGSLIYKGKAIGEFEAGKPCPVAVGAADGQAFLGDFDADPGAPGLDVVTTAPKGATRMWNNRGGSTSLTAGKFEFVETLGATGELAYKGGAGAAGGAACDFNNDGRQDLLFFYAASSPYFYFNRGFRSFGLANGLDPGNNNLVPSAEDGQQAGCVADFTGNGAQTAIVILKNGQAWAFYPETTDGKARCVRAALSSKGPYVGPLTVTGWQKDRPLGAWNVTAGTGEAFFGRGDAGPITLKWQFPGGKPQQKEVIVENGPVRVVLAP